MDPAIFSALVGYAIIACLSPGPNNTMLMSSAAVFGWRKTLPFMLGILLGFQTLIAAAVFGLGIVLEKFPWMVMLVVSFGAAWLIWLGYKFIAAGWKLRSQNEGANTVKTNKPAQTRPFRAYEGALLQLANPKAMVLAISSASGYATLAPTISARAAIIMATFFVCGNFAAATWIFAGNALNKHMSSGPAAGIINIIMGLLLIATAIIIVITGLKHELPAI